MGAAEFVLARLTGVVEVALAALGAGATLLVAGVAGRGADGLEELAGAGTES